MADTTSDGLAILQHVSEGALAGDHPDRRAPLVVAPTDGDGLNTLAPPLRTVACWRLDDPRFQFDSSLIQPGAAEDFRAFGKLLDAHPGAPPSVFGHADPVGREDYNKTLSGRRAEAVYAALTREIGSWERLFTQPFGGDDWSFKGLQMMLTAVGFPCPPDGQRASKTTKAATTDFQTAHADELAVDGDLGTETRKRLFRAYMDLLCDRGDGTSFTVARSAFLGGGADPTGKADFQGCGEFNALMRFSKEEDDGFKPAARKAARDAENSINRRVTVLLFQPGTAVTPAKWPCPRAREGTADCKKRFFADAADRQKPGAARRSFGGDQDTFACRFYQGLAQRSPCERLIGAPTLVTLRVVDHLDFPFTGEVAIVVDDQAKRGAVPSDDGLVSVVMPAGAFTAFTGAGQFLHIDGQYPVYKHDPLAGNTELGAPDEMPGIKDGRAVETLEEVADHLNDLYEDEDLPAV